MCTAVHKIREHLFHRYWLQLADKAATHGERGYDVAYEKAVFEQINTMLRQGKKPITVRHKVRPVTAEKVRGAKGALLAPLPSVFADRGLQNP